MKVLSLLANAARLSERRRHAVWDQKIGGRDSGRDAGWGKKARRLGKKGAISFDLGPTVGKESLQGIEFKEGSDCFLDDPSPQFDWPKKV